MLLNLSGSVEWKEYAADGRIVVPKRRAPTVLQASRTIAELEAVRLARQLEEPIAVFELVGIVEMLHGHSHVTVGGLPIKAVEVPTWSDSLEIP